jgi:tellurite resistance protein TerC
MLALDLGVFHRKTHELSLKEAAAWSALWVALSGVFALAVRHFFGPQRALEFTTGYLLEKALSVDNLFVIVLLFSAFSIPVKYQHRVLFWGVLGALVMRAGFIALGSAFVHKFHWAMYVFGGVLVVSGLKLLWQREEEVHPEKNPILKLVRRFVPVTSELVEGRFTVRRDGRRWITPLMVALIAVEVTDLIFAADSIPAIFAVTTDPFIVFTSNIFAILGLRSMYFLLAGVVGKFHYLKTGLSFVLLFVGAKMLLADAVTIPIGTSLAAIAGILALSIVASLLRPPSAPNTAAHGSGPAL